MFTHIPDALKKVRKSVYYPDADLNVCEQDEAMMPLTDMDELNRVTEGSLHTYNATIRQFDASIRKVEEILVNKISVAVTMGLPHMRAEMIEQALYAKQRYTAGELDFESYICIMSELFPDRMLNLPEDLNRRIKACRSICVKQ